MTRRILIPGLLALLASFGSAQITVDVGGAKSSGDISALAERSARQFAANLDRATARVRADLARAGRFHPEHPLSFPATIWLERDGRPVALPAAHGPKPRTGGLTLVFDSSGPRAFPTAYQAKLQGIFNTAQSTLNSVFGQPAVSGNVHVLDYNADISDRGFFSGGFYIPNASPPEIHFPEYSDDASTAVNFIHVLLLAYLGPNQYGFDAFNEGLVRAATIKVARNPSALPGFDQAAIGDVIENSYDVGPWYDWYNQRALGGSHFVAPNLASQPLNGGVGGLWLMRYRMAGAAWQKMVAEHPSFIASFNSAFYLNPSIASDVPALVTLGQTTLNSIAGGNPTIEGLSFSGWFRRQFVLETKDTGGHKILIQPVPLTSGLVAGDYGPYLVQAYYFQTLAGGNEVLSGATSYPIFWEGDINLTRVFTTVQDETLTITGSYGAIAPNLPDNNGGVPYRATIDVPVESQLGRVYLPAGSIATGANPTPMDFYGTVTGVFLQSGDSLKLQVTVGGSPLPDIPVTPDGAFGVIIGTGAYLDFNTISVDVVRHNAGGDSVLLSRAVDKGPGPLALDLRVGSDTGYTFPNPIPKGISTIGFPVDPWASLDTDLVGDTTLVARYDPSTARYDLFPDAESFKIGLGFFLRSDTTQTPFTVSGRIHKNIAGSVSLRPGWNLIANPLTETTSTDRILSVRKADFPQFFTGALGTDIGTVFFEFQPGANDGATGAPETGSMIPATIFEQGKAYFVRVLAPEGVTLTFSPAAGTSPPPPPVIEQSRVAGGQGWLMGVTMFDGAFHVGAQIGQSTTATRGFDPREDAEMPPALTGGRQVTVIDSGSMYRDTRVLGVSETFTLRFTGLKPGRRYVIRFDKVRNSPGVFALLRSDGTIAGHFAVGEQVTMTASGPTATLKIRVSGGMGR